MAANSGPNAIRFYGPVNKLHVYFYNNTIYGYGEEGVDVAVATEAAINMSESAANYNLHDDAQWYWYNNIVYDVADQAYFYAYDSDDYPDGFDNNIWYDGGDNNPVNIPTWDNTTPIEEDPVFTTPGTDFSLQATSPAMGQGTDGSAYFTTDFAGTTRAVPWDIGAYEYGTGEDEIDPTITNVTSDKANGTYGVGEVIDIDVTFSETVTSTGNVTVTLETGDTDRTCTFTVTGASSGTCNYTVEAGDTSADLTVKTIAGTIADGASNAMTDFAPATNLAANKAIVINTAVSETKSMSAGSFSGGTHN